MLERDDISANGESETVDPQEGILPVIGMQYECIWVKTTDGMVDKISAEQLQDRVRGHALTALDHVSFDGNAWTRLGTTRIWREASRT